MDGYIVRGPTALPRGSLLLIEHGKGMQIELWDGELWITQEGDTRDYVIGPGSSFRLGREGIVLANVFKPGRFTITAAVPAHYAERIVVTPVGSVPHVLYERSRERGGRLAGIGHRIPPYWAKLYAAYAHPATATPSGGKNHAKTPTGSSGGGGPLCPRRLQSRRQRLRSACRGARRELHRAASRTR